ncbi:hypothetical protein P4H71_21065 [Paenibacillus kribbensis]|nr:hypothetical protein [Paenibacillus kribbensis]MEC0236813.1 hypothetical protein [Paenibacillus kribbensis]
MAPDEIERMKHTAYACLAAGGQGSEKKYKRDGQQANPMGCCSSL